MEPQLVNDDIAAAVLKEMVDFNDKPSYRQGARFYEMLPRQRMPAFSRGFEGIIDLQPSSNLSSKLPGLYPELQGGNPRYVRTRVYYTVQQAAEGYIRDAMMNIQQSSVPGADFIASTADRIRRELNQEMNNQAYGDPSNTKGIVGTILNTGVNGAIYTQGPFYQQNLRKGAVYEFFSQGGIQRQAGVSRSRLIRAVAGTAGTPAKLIFDSLPTDLQTDDTIHRQGSRNAGLNGLRYHLDSVVAPWQGLSRTDLPEIQQTLLPIGASPLTFTVLDALRTARRLKLGTMGDYSGEGSSYNEISRNIESWLINTFAIEALRQQGTVIRRDPTSQRTLDLTYTTIEHHGLPFKDDVDCPVNQIYLLDMSACKFFEVQPLTEIQGDAPGGGNLRYTLIDNQFLRTSAIDRNWEMRCQFYFKIIRTSAVISTSIPPEYPDAVAAFAV